MKRLVYPSMAIGLIIIISLFTTSTSFKLALFGDDWQQIWKFFENLGPKPNLINYFTYFIGGYGSFEVMTGTLYRIFGNDYKMYYIFAYIYRLIFALSLWPLTFYLTRSKLAAFFASLFLSVTIIGMESTNWVVNSPAYLGGAFLSLFLYFYIKSREDLKVKSFLLALLFFYLTHIFASIRVTGLLPFTIALELFLYLKSSNIKLSLRRLFFIILSFIVITTVSSAAEGSGTLVGGASTIIGAGLSSILTLLKQGRTDFLFYPIMTVGRLIIPNTITFRVPMLLLAIGLFIITMNFNIPQSKKVTPIITIGLIIWSIVSWLIYSVNKTTLSVNDTFSLAVGGYVIIFGLVLLIFNKKNTLSVIFFIGVFWTLFSYIFPWVRAPETLQPTEQRYLVTSSIGIATLLAGVIGLGKEFKTRVNLFLLVIPFIIINIYATRVFFEAVVQNSHGAEAMNEIWTAFPAIPGVGKTDRPLIFYFSSNPSNEALKHHSLTFGFPYRMAMIYHIYDPDIYESIARMPMSTNEWNDLTSALTDDNYLVKFAYHPGKVPLDNIYAFFLTPDNQLINVTTEARNKLKEQLNIK